MVPFQAFETKTGPVIVAAGNDRLFVKLANVVGHPEWAKDPRFTTNAARVENKAALCDMIDAIFLTRSKGEWIDLLEAEGVPCSVINSLPEAASHPQAAALDIIQPMPGEDFSLVALPISFDGARPKIRSAPPASASTTSRSRPGSAGERPSRRPPRLADGDGRHGGARAALDLQRLHHEGELLDALGRELVQLQVLEDVDAVHHQHDLVDRQRKVRVGVGRNFDRPVVGADQQRILLGQPLAAATPMPGHVFT